MSEPERKQAEQQAKIYLSVLAGLLVVAILVTMFTLYRPETPSAEVEESQAEQLNQNAEALRERLKIQQEQQEAQAVQQDLNEANSQIQKEAKSTEVTPENSGNEQTKEGPTSPEIENKQESLPEQEEEIEEGDASEEFAAEPQNMTAAFDPDEDLMVWPVSGVVLMDYSSDALIYDRTLDLYRTNDSISIGAEEAEDVLAAADGIVTDIGRSDTLGNYIVLDNGSGYETTYGQLSEDMAVNVGEYVDQGEVLGCIDAPSWYSSALGTHLTFTVKVNGATVNPLEFLENVLDDE